MMGLALTYIIGLESAVRKLFGSCCNLETSMVSAERCYAYTELEQEDENIVATDIKNWPETGDIAFERSEERRVGKEGLRLCRSRWSPYH